MRCRGRVNNQRAGVADIGKVREQFDIGDQVHAGVVAALEPESEHRAGAERTIFLGEVVITVARQPRIADPRHFRMRRYPFGDRLRVLAVLLHAQRQRLDPGQDEE